jgi:hypothetical protein
VARRAATGGLAASFGDPGFDGSVGYLAVQRDAEEPRRARAGAIA